MVHTTTLSSHSQAYGALFPHPTRLRVKEPDGLMLVLRSSAPNTQAARSSAEPSFLVDCLFEESGKHAVVMDSRGNVFSLLFEENRFSMLARSGHGGLCVGFASRFKPMVLAGLRNNKLHMYNGISRALEGNLAGLTSSPVSLFTAPDGHTFGCCSEQELLLWETTRGAPRVATLRKTVHAPGLTQASFDPEGRILAVCNGRVSKIFLLDAHDFSVLGFLEPWGDNSLVPPAADRNDLSQSRGPSKKRTFDVETLSTFVFSPNSRLIVAGGRSQKLYVWEYDSFNLLKVVDLPLSARNVVQMQFSEDSQTLYLLTGDGVLRAVDADSFKITFDIRLPQTNIVKFHVQPQMERMLFCVLSSGQIYLYDLQASRDNFDKIKKMRHARGDSFLESKKVKGVVSKLSPKSVAAASSSSRAVRTPPTPGTLSRWIRPSDEKLKEPFGGPEHSLRIRGLEGSGVELNFDRLKDLLQAYGEYPEAYRRMVWKFLLHLPENHDSFELLASRGTHSSFRDLAERYHLPTRRACLRLQKTLSSLAHWCDLFAEVPFLPELIHPIVQTFEGNAMDGFEVVATYLLNWCRFYFEYFPAPPVDILHFVADCLHELDPELFCHLDLFGLSPEDTVWPMLRCSFSEVFTRGEWLQLFDHVFSNEPLFLPCVAVAYVLEFRNVLLQMREAEQMKRFFRQTNPVNVTHVISRAMRILKEVRPIIVENTSSCLHPLVEFHPLTTGMYPPFHHYPKHIVNYQAKIRQKAQQDEEEALLKRQNAMEIDRKRAMLDAEERAFQARQEALAYAENQASEQRNTLWSNVEEERERAGEMEKYERLRHLEALKRAADRSASQRLKATEAVLGSAANAELSSLARKIEQGKARVEEESRLLELEQAASKRWQDESHRRAEEAFQRQLENEVTSRQRKLAYESQLFEQHTKAQEQERLLRLEAEIEKQNRVQSLQEKMEIKRATEVKLQELELEAELQRDLAERQQRLRMLMDEHRLLVNQEVERQKEFERARLATDKVGMQGIVRQSTERHYEQERERARAYHAAAQTLNQQIEQQKARVAELRTAESQAVLQEKLLATLKEQQGAEISEEREVQRMMLELDNARRQARVDEYEIGSRAQQLQEQLELQRKLHEAADRILIEERERFNSFRSRMDLELEQQLAAAGVQYPTSSSSAASAAATGGANASRSRSKGPSAQKPPLVAQYEDKLRESVQASEREYLDREKKVMEAKRAEFLDRVRRIHEQGEGPSSDPSDIIDDLASFQHTQQQHYHGSNLYSGSDPLADPSSSRKPSPAPAHSSSSSRGTTVSRKNVPSPSRAPEPGAVPRDTFSSAPSAVSPSEASTGREMSPITPPSSSTGASRLGQHQHKQRSRIHYDMHGEEEEEESASTSATDGGNRSMSDSETSHSGTHHSYVDDLYKEAQHVIQEHRAVRKQIMPPG